MFKHLPIAEVFDSVGHACDHGVADLIDSVPRALTDCGILAQAGWAATGAGDPGYGWHLHIGARLAGFAAFEPLGLRL